MGVLEFFSTLVRTDITSNAIQTNFAQKINIDHLLIDFNSIIHVSGQENLSAINSFFKLVLRNLYMKRGVDSEKFTQLFTKYKMTKVQSKIKPDTDPMVVVEAGIGYGVRYLGSQKRSKQKF